MDDLISRQAAIEALQNHYEVRNPKQNAIMDECVMLIFNVPSAQPDLDEWCTDCSEYDQERHCCPRWNRVIRQTLKDAQPTADEVVRCNDCKYDHKCSHNIIRPSKGGGIIYCPLEYCSEGERKES